MCLRYWKLCVNRTSGCVAERDGKVKVFQNPFDSSQTELRAPGELERCSIFKRLGFCGLGVTDYVGGAGVSLCTACHDDMQRVTVLRSAVSNEQGSEPTLLDAAAEPSPVKAATQQSTVERERTALFSVGGDDSRCILISAEELGDSEPTNTATKDPRTPFKATRAGVDVEDTPVPTGERAKGDKGKLKETTGAALRYRRAKRAMIMGAEYGPLTNMGNHSRENRFWPA